MSSQVKIEYYECPGIYLPALQRSRLTASLRALGKACFGKVPDYQCFSERDGLDDKVLTVARGPDGKLLGFASALLLDVPGIRSSVLHLGLTCVHPDARGLRLTHRLASQLAVRYLLRNNPLGRVWISNVACVLSSLGNVALNFDSVYPSPFRSSPSDTHLLIARTISEKYRQKIYIHEDAPLDESAFVFRGSVKGTVFQKDADDTQYYHRESSLNSYYKSLLQFQEGDEAVQIGHFSLATFARYLSRKMMGRKAVVPQIQAPVATVVVKRAA